MTTLELALPDIISLCQRYQVHRLDVFGSATNEAFDPQRSDYDFLVEFMPLSPEAYAANYFGLWEGLQECLQRPVDLMTVASPGMQNPYFRQALEESRRTLYAA